jgi:hypothetical protein
MSMELAMSARAAARSQLDLFRHGVPHTHSKPTAISPPATPQPPLAAAAPATKHEVAQGVAKAIAARVGCEVALKVHDNRSTMVSFRKQSGRLTVRLHHMFLTADNRTIEALADYVGHAKKSAGAVLDAFIARHQNHIQKQRPQGHVLESRGAFFNLAEIFEVVNRSYFDNAIVARIGWGRNGKGKRMRKRTVRLGVYDHRLKEIRIHPVLDQHWVPKFFVEYIVFHEMLHQQFPTVEGNGRLAHHPPQFRLKERQFKHFGDAQVWERAHLRLLLANHH